MIKCPHCGAENKKKAAFCVQCHKPLPKKVWRPGKEPLVERVPPWLKSLLNRYGEYEGPLIGLEEPDEVELPEEVASSISSPPSDAAATGLSELLEQMADTNFSSLESERPATSVEWGGYTEESPIPEAPAMKESPPEDEPPLNETAPPSLDEFFSSLEAGQTPTTPSEPSADEMDLPDWLTSDAAQPGESELPAPDWLTDAESASLPDQAETSSTEEIEIPDWLTGESPADESTPPAQTPENPAESSETESTDIPDWLAEALEQPSVPAGAPSAPEPSEPSPQSPTTIVEDAQIPDWLLDTLDTISEQDEGVATPDVGIETPTQAEAKSATGAEIPAWLNEITPSPSTEKPEEARRPSETEPVAGADIPDWLRADEPLQKQESSPDIADEADWLAAFQSSVAEDSTDIPMPQTPDWLQDIDVPTVADNAEITSPPPVDQLPELDLAPPPESPEPPVTEESPPEKQVTESPSTRQKLKRLKSLKHTTPTPESPPAEPEPEPAVEAPAPEAPEEAGAEAELPDWLAGLPSVEPETSPATGPSEKTGIEAAEVPDWLAGISNEADFREDVLTDEFLSADSALELPEWLKEAEEMFSADVTPTAPTAEIEREEAPSLSDAEKTMPPETPQPPQEIVADKALTEPGLVLPEDQAEAIRRAAHTFHTIATQPPEPATLPEPLTQREQLIRHTGRAIFLLLFIGLVILPLLPGLQKIDPAGRPVPWTEPVGPFGDELDRQRRELISNELGVIDLQQPGAVALVSLDYTPATQGEMEPLARAVIGRLRGQGMRVIFVSLQPEGAPLAHNTIKAILQERNESYGEQMINLGYLPGEVAAVRALVSGQRQFATMQDYNTGQPLKENQQWADIQSFRQIGVVVTLADNPATARWWVEQMETAVEPDADKRYLLAVTSAATGPFLRPYRLNGQLDGLLSGINGAAAVEASRKNFGPARQMLDSQSIAHLFLIIVIAVGTMVGWMPTPEPQASSQQPPAN